jgi:hypothetical protein
VHRKDLTAWERRSPRPKHSMVLVSRFYGLRVTQILSRLTAPSKAKTSGFKNSFRYKHAGHWIDTQIY